MKSEELKELAKGIATVAKGISFSRDKNFHQDAVNHPTHYANGTTTEVECIMFTRNMSFDLGNAFKYVWRAGHKDNAKQDLEKALWYLKDSNLLTPQSYLYLLAFLPKTALSSWKYGILHAILLGETFLAITRVEEVLKSYEDCRLINSPSVDESGAGR